ncbi:50S ribosomal protein L32e [Thermoplasmatales archaeon ex4484_30]|nr:MAG: 50S ribosomal protein L32e [Thermoplasmatales archaeon ex4484_30]
MEEEVKIVEEGEYTPKKKAKIDEETKKLLSKKKKPKFLRQQWFQFKRLGMKWRRPKGRHSKLRKSLGYRPPKPKIGYGTPKKIRGLHPSGFKEKIVYCLKDLENVDAEREAIRIAHGVGKKKRMEIIGIADEKGIRVLNRGV